MSGWSIVSESDAPPSTAKGAPESAWTVVDEKSPDELKFENAVGNQAIASVPKPAFLSYQPTPIDPLNVRGQGQGLRPVPPALNLPKPSNWDVVKAVAGSSLPQSETPLLPGVAPTMSAAESAKAGRGWETGSHLLEAAGEVATPLVGPALADVAATGSLPTALKFGASVAASAGLPKAAQKISEKLGAGPEQQKFWSNLAAWAPLTYAAIMGANAGGPKPTPETTPAPESGGGPSAPPSNLPGAGTPSIPIARASGGTATTPEQAQDLMDMVNRLPENMRGKAIIEIHARTGNQILVQEPGPNGKMQQVRLMLDELPQKPGAPPPGAQPPQETSLLDAAVAQTGPAGGQAPPPAAPAPPVLSGALAAAANSMAQAEAAASQAKLQASGYVPPTPPAPPRVHEVPDEMVQKEGDRIAALPTEQRAPAIIEAHQQLAKSLLEQGKIIVNGKLEIIKNPDQADSVAQKLINDEMSRRDKLAATSKESGKGAGESGEATRSSITQTRVGLKKAGGFEVVSEEEKGVASTDDASNQGRATSRPSSRGLALAPGRGSKETIQEAGSSGFQVVGEEPRPQKFQKGDQVVLPDGRKGTVYWIGANPQGKDIARVRDEKGAKESIDASTLKAPSSESTQGKTPLSAEGNAPQQADAERGELRDIQHPTNIPSILYARHGETQLDVDATNETVAGWTSEPLDDRGIASAHKLAGEVREHKPTVIISSDLERAKQTADIVGKDLGIPVKTDERLRPQHVPETEGLKVGAAKPIWQDYEDNPTKKPEGGESWKEFEDRQAGAIKDIHDLIAKGERPMVVTHSRNLESAIGERPEPGEFVKREADKPERTLPSQYGPPKKDFQGKVPAESLGFNMAPAEDFGNKARAEVERRMGGALPRGATERRTGEGTRQETPSVLPENAVKKSPETIEANRGGGVSGEAGAAPTKYKFGNTQAPIHPESEAAKALETARVRISDSDLAGEGKDIGDGGNHVTVRYGIQDDETGGIKKFLSQQPPFEATLGKTEAFPPSEHSDGAAVIIAPVNAPELHRLNAELEKHGDFTEPSFKEYKPHATVAYVDPTKADRYTGMSVTEGKKFIVDRVAITDRNGKAEIVKLEGKRDVAVPTSAGGSQPGEPTRPAAPEYTGTKEETLNEQQRHRARLSTREGIEPKLPEASAGQPPRSSRESQPEEIAQSSAEKSFQADLDKRVESLREKIKELKKQTSAPAAYFQDSKKNAAERQERSRKINLLSDAQSELREIENAHKYELAKTLTPEETVSKEGKNFEGRYVRASLEPVKEAWIKKWPKAEGDTDTADEHWKWMVKSFNDGTDKPTGFKKSHLYIKVPDDGSFYIPNTPAAIDHALKAAGKFESSKVGEALPKAGAKKFRMSSPKEFDNAKYIAGLEKEIEELEGKMPFDKTDLRYPHMQEELKAARENLAEAKNPESLLGGESGEARPAELAKAAVKAAAVVGDYVRSEVHLNKISRELQSGMYDLEAEHSGRVLEAVQTMERIAKEYTDRKADFLEDAAMVYDHQEDPEGIGLTKSQDDLLDDTVLPLMEDTQEKYEALKELDGQQAHLVDNYVHRVTKGKGGWLDRIASGFRKGTGRGNLLSKSAPQTKGRTMMAIESLEGDRRVISIKGGKATMWVDGESVDLGEIKNAKGKSDVENETFPEGEPNSVFYDQGKIVEGPDGYDWKITQATTREIEENTGIRYYHNALASALVSNLQVSKALRGAQFIEAFKDSPQFKEVAFKGAKPPDGWKITQLPQMKDYYFEPHVAEVLDWYAERLRGGDPSIMEKVGQFLRTSIFFNPLIHIPNITVHWAVERGLTGYNPVRLPAASRAGLKAINAVIHQNQDFLDALEAGAPLQSHREDVATVTQLFFDQLTEGLEKKEDWALELAKKIGMSPVTLIKGIYRFSGKATWVTNDIAVLQSAYEKMGRNPGMKIADALKETSKHIPDYRLPTRMLNSRALAKLLSNPNISMFMAYHYGAAKSYGEAAKSAIGMGGGGGEEPPQNGGGGNGDGGDEPEPGKRSKAGEIAHGWELLATIGLVTFVLYPLLDKIVQAATGDKNAKLRRAGAATLPYNIYKVATGQESVSDAIQSIATPAIQTKSAGELVFNRDLHSGKNIYDSTADWYTQGQQVGRKLAESVSPVGQASRLMEGGPEARKRFGWGLVGVSFQKSRAERVAAQIALQKAGTKAQTPEDREEYVERRDILDELRKGNRRPLMDAERTRAITPQQASTIQRRALRDPLEDTVYNFSVPEVKKVLEAAKADGNDKQVQLLQRVLREKRLRLILRGEFEKSREAAVE